MSSIPQSIPTPQGETPFYPGQSVFWCYTPRGGYGYAFAVPATVIKVCTKRVLIDALLKSGNTKRVYAKAENLKAARAEGGAE